MDSFKSKYPAMTLLLALIGAMAAKAVVPGEAAVAKIEDELTLAPQMLGVYGQASSLSSELQQLKASLTDIEAASEVLVTDLALSSDRAKAIVPKAFAVAEWVVQGVQPIEDLRSAIKG